MLRPRPAGLPALTSLPMSADRGQLSRLRINNSSRLAFGQFGLVTAAHESRFDTEHTSSGEIGRVAEPAALRARTPQRVVAT